MQFSSSIDPRSIESLVQPENETKVEKKQDSFDKLAGSGSGNARLKNEN